MFGLFAGRGKRVERRLLCFGPVNDGDESPVGGLGDVMEVRVFRAKGQKRIVPEVERFDKISNLRDAGRRGMRQDLVEAGGVRYHLRSEGRRSR